MKQINNIELVQVINSGGTATVYLGIDLFTGHPVAVKELKANMFKSDFVRKKFIEEANQYLYMDHPNIVKLKDFIITNDNHYLVMEYVDGKNLYDHMTTVTGPLPLQNVALLLNEVLSALTYVHDRKLIHLDIKPSNIMLSNSNAVKLVDFGISQDKKSTVSEQPIGSPAYMSPEQVEDQTVDFQSDIYSTGITMFELLTGSLPFQSSETREELFQAIKTNKMPHLKANNSHDVVHEEEMNRIFRKATTKDKRQRYQSCEAFQLDIIQFI
jgi:eukaryotic-like serine/threonine-protein kinase